MVQVYMCRTLLHLRESGFNWFQFYERVECMMEESSNLDVSKSLEEIFLQMPHLEFSQRQLELAVQSHRAFVAATSASYEEERMARSINGEIVSESESEDPEQYIGVKNVMSEAGKLLVMKKRTAIKKRARRLRAKTLAERRFLSRKVSKRTSKILRHCPNIGETIESFVEDHRCLAQNWGSNI